MPDKSAVKIISFPKLIPNMLTILSMCAGLSSIRFALLGKWEWVILAILFAAIFDALDGAMARLLKATSQFGAELDSLADFLSFGVAPAIVSYLWIMEASGNIGWFACMIFAIATGLRLARFNVESKAKTAVKKSEPSMFFEGIPSPAGALLSLLPMCLTLYFGENTVHLGRGGWISFDITSTLVALWMIIISGLMISSVPTFSIKKLKIPQKFALPLLAGLTLLVAAMITRPWLTLSLIGVIYLVGIPFSVRYARRLKKTSEKTSNKTSKKAQK